MNTKKMNTVFTYKSRCTLYQQ